MNTTTIQREQAQRIYEMARADLLFHGLEYQVAVQVNDWLDLHEYGDPNDYLVRVLGDDVWEESFNTDDWSEFTTVLEIVDAILIANPIIYRVTTRVP